MMSCYPEEDRARFSVVDTMSYFENQFDVVKRNLADQGLDADQVDFRVASSDQAFARAEGNQDRFDFIVIDASHKIRYVMDDMRWLRLLNVGGHACFHDYAPQFYGVRLPIDRFLRRNPHFVRMGQAGSLLCVRKEREAATPEVTASDRLWALLRAPVLQWELLSLSNRRKRKAARKSA